MAHGDRKYGFAELLRDIVRHGKSWLFHWGLSVAITVAFAIAGHAIWGAWAAVGGYTFRELQEIINHSAPSWWLFDRTPNPKPTIHKWIDHVGDLLGAYLVLLATLLLVV